MNEFSLIENYFKPLSIQRKEVLFGIGDDAACLQIPPGENLLVSTDSLVSGVHFLPEWDAYDIAYKAVMVNVSDMAAMAADPCWITLALTLPKLEPKWLNSFAQGLKDSLTPLNVDLIGGDTTRGPLSITLTIFGLAPAGQSVRRSGAKPGDIIMVSGLLGAAALAVQLFDNKAVAAADKEILMDKLLHPQPRIDLISFLRLYASSAIDISDGLSADLNHICVASGVGACLVKETIPMHPLLKKYLGDQAIDLALRGGDDYELCFTISSAHEKLLMSQLQDAHLKCYPIGVIEETPGLRMKTAGNAYEALIPGGYLHF